MVTPSKPDQGFPRPQKPQRERFFSLPHARLGWWALGLDAAFIALFFFDQRAAQHFWRFRVPFPFILALPLIGLALGVVTVIRRHEHSGLVFLAIFLGLFVLFFVVASLLSPI